MTGGLEAGKQPVLKQLLLYANTVRYLRLRQIASRMKLMARGRMMPFLSGRSEPVTVSDVRARLRPVVPFALRRSTVLNSAEGLQFTFLNDSHRFGESIDWQAPQKDRLWRYNLHYFDYVLSENELPAGAVSGLMIDWIRKNPRGAADAWDPYPLSLRAVNWMKYLDKSNVERQIRDDIEGSLYEQLAFLEKSLEYHLLANHLFKNLKALVFGGLFFNDGEAEGWLSSGLCLLDEQLDVQIARDGGHFERSPMYHSMIFEDCLDLLNVLKGSTRRFDRSILEKLSTVSADMARFVVAMCQPDGEISLFNDSAFRIETPPGKLVRYYEGVADRVVPEVTGRITALSDTGYFVMSPDDGNKLIVDCGPVGPDYQPGHSHCDTLSFELSLRKRRIIVDSGCYGYEYGEMRQYNRGNAGHNTVTIDGRNQSEVWSSHRCGRRAYPIRAELKEEGGSLVFEGAHDGYARLRGRPVHRRRIVWSGKILRIQDEVAGKGRHDVEVRFHVNPDLIVTMESGSVAIRDDQEVLATLSWPEGAPFEFIRGWYCPEFGVKRPCPVITVTFKNVRLPFRTECTFEIAR
jgi:uncharacterized heparinase superfamily protein